MQGFERRLTAVLETALAAGMLGILLIIVVLVAMRYLFHSGMVGANEIATVAFVYLSSIGSAVAVGRQEHINVDVLPRKLDRRRAKVLRAGSLILVGLLNAVIVACCFRWILTTGHTPMPTSQIPRYMAQASIPLGCGIAVFYCCVQLSALLREEPGA